MKIVIAMDSFKGSLSSLDAGNACAAGILRAVPDADINVFPAADGGEGTTEALVHGLNGTFRTVTASDPLGRPISAKYGKLPDQTAVIEMAAASGLTLLTASERNPMRTTTRGFGEMIADAIHQGCRSFLLGIGGSATNDCGIGCLQALGFKFCDRNGNQVPPGAEGISMVHAIRTENKMPELTDCHFSVACDVTNPLYGPNGCSTVFAPQKGASSRDVAIMDQAMQKYAALVRQYDPEADPMLSGSGAAGGMGFALRTFLHAELCSGISLVMKQTGIESAIAQADIVITGEGRLDAQSVMGKVPVGIAGIAKKYNIPVIAFCGCAGNGAGMCNQHGIDAYFPILRRMCSESEAMDLENAKQNLNETAEQVFRLYQLQDRMQ